MMREDLRKAFETQVAAAMEVRTRTESMRVQNGAGPFEIHMCLGSGRCMFPRQGNDERVCAFCMALPSGRAPGVERGAAEVAKIFVGGN